MKSESNPHMRTIIRQFRKLSVICTRPCTSGSVHPVMLALFTANFENSHTYGLDARYELSLPQRERALDPKPNVTMPVIVSILLYLSYSYSIGLHSLNIGH